MRELTKAQLAIGLLAFFATIWDLLLILLNQEYIDWVNLTLLVVIQLVLLLVLAYVILALLEWVGIFDLKTNAILTLLVLVTMRLLSTAASATTFV